MCKWLLQKLTFFAVLWCLGMLDVSASMFTPLVKQYEVKVINRYPHDEQSFTQGLLFSHGFLYESVGLRGQSALFKVELKTGRILQRFTMEKHYFAEGLALLPDELLPDKSLAGKSKGDKLIQLTYTANKGFVYDRRSLSRVGEFTIPGSGWGLTRVADELVMTDGSAELIFLDSKTFKVSRRLTIKDNKGPVEWLNELEYVDGFLLANVWQTSDVAVIDLNSGKVVSYIDLSALLEQIGLKRRRIDKGFEADIPGALNGIAYDTQGGRLFLTGKNWPWVFEVSILAVK